MKTVKTKYKPAFAALRRGRQNLIAATFVCTCALAVSTAFAQNNYNSAFDSKLTLRVRRRHFLRRRRRGGQRQGPGGAELAKKLQNPVANLVSVPIQNNWDFGIAQADAMEPRPTSSRLFPVSISQDWNLIIRTIMPVIYAEAA